MMSTKYKGSTAEVRALDAYIALKRAESAISKPLNVHIIEHNLTSGQFGILEALFHLGPLSQKDLGKKVLSTKANITMLIDNLEKKALVKRQPDSHDRRIAIIHLTASGKSFIAKIVPQHVKKITAIMSTLTVTELKELKTLCKKLGLATNEEYNI